MRSRLFAAACLMPLALAACGRADPAPNNVLPAPPPSPPPEPAPPPLPAPAPPDNDVAPAPPNRNCGGSREDNYMCPGPCLPNPNGIGCTPTMRTCTRVVANPPCLDVAPVPPPIVAPRAANMAN